MIVDAGLAFPRDEHLGVDLVLPDFTYLRERESMIRGVVLTHGHEDHVGSLPYLMREVKIPVIVATRLTLGLVKSKLDEHGLLREADLREAAPGDEPLQPRAVPDRARAHGALDPRRGRRRPRDAGRADRAHGRLQDRPHAGRRPANRRRQARRDRQPRRRPPARRLDERRAPRRHPIREGRRRGVRADLPEPQGPHPRRVVRVERPPHAAGGRCRDRLRPQGRLRRPVDEEELEHRAQPRLHGRPGERDPEPEADQASCRPRSS